MQDVILNKIKCMKYKICLLITIFYLGLGASAENRKSPHGANFKIDCTQCHTTENWNKIKEKGFNHNQTKFPLVGQHKTVGCRKCHTDLNFSKAPLSCSSCHTDMHEGTTGPDCARCHTSNSWIVTKVKRLHQQAGFPLIGEHATADCNRCHTSASKLKFENIRSDCFSCHKSQYDMTRKPNHKVSGFGIDCQRCHNMVGSSWNSIGRGFDHNAFYPLTGAHKTAECTSCHWDNYSQAEKEDLSAKKECKSCHGVRNNNPIPAHKTKYASYDCSACHNTTEWKGVKFPQHDSWGKIYSGEHKGEWNACTDCHNNDAAYVANCRKCHNFSTGRLP